MIIICTLHCVYTAGVSACFEVLVSLWQLLYFATTSSPPFFQSSHDFIIAPQHCKQCPFPLIANLCGWSGSIKSLTVSPYNPPPPSIHSHPHELPLPTTPQTTRKGGHQPPRQNEGLHVRLRRRSLAREDADSWRRGNAELPQRSRKEHILLRIPPPFVLIVDK